MVLTGSVQVMKTDLVMDFDGCCHTTGMRQKFKGFFGFGGDDKAKEEAIGPGPGLGLGCIG